MDITFYNHLGNDVTVIVPDGTKNTVKSNDTFHDSYTSGDYQIILGSKTYTLLGTGINKLVPHSYYHVHLVDDFDLAENTYTTPVNTYQLGGLGLSWSIMLALDKKKAATYDNPGGTWTSLDFDSIISYQHSYKLYLILIVLAIIVLAIVVAGIWFFKKKSSKQV